MVCLAFPSGRSVWALPIRTAPTQTSAGHIHFMSIDAIYGSIVQSDQSPTGGVSMRFKLFATGAVLMSLALASDTVASDTIAPLGKYTDYERSHWSFQK